MSDRFARWRDGRSICGLPTNRPTSLGVLSTDHAWALNQGPWFQAAGYPDVIAPPTFPVVVAMAASGMVVRDPGLGLNYAMVVHGEQRFEYSRPLHAGDLVTAQSTISAIREVGSITMLITETQIRTVDGEHVCTGIGTLVERGTA